MSTINKNRKNIYISSPWLGSDFENLSVDCIQLVFDLSGIALDSGNIPYPARLYSRSRCAENVFIVLHENLMAADEVWILAINKLTPIMMYDLFAAEMAKKPVYFIKNPLSFATGEESYPENWEDYLIPFNDHLTLCDHWLKAINAIPNFLGHDFTSFESISAKSMYLIFRNLYQAVYGQVWDAFEGLNLDDADDQHVN